MREREEGREEENYLRLISADTADAMLSLCDVDVVSVAGKAFSWVSSDCSMCYGI